LNKIDTKFNNFSIKATADLQNKLKVGIYRELHRKGLLSKEHLLILVGPANTNIESNKKTTKKNNNSKEEK